jgi:hypothetical protein
LDRLGPEEWLAPLVPAAGPVEFGASRSSERMRRRRRRMMTQRDF